MSTPIPTRTTSATTLEAVADALRFAELRGVPIAPVSSTWRGLTVEDAYAIQRANARYRLAAGGRVVGHKIGLTSEAMQRMLGVHEPDYGRIFEDCVLSSGDELASDGLIAPRIEPEIAFVLGDGLRGPDVTADQALAATAYVLPALEVIDSRIADWKITLVDTVADNASCARVVLGQRRTAPSDVAMAAAMAQLRVDGRLVQQGPGAAVLGHPARAVAWLANAVARFGVALEPGQVILPGSLTAAEPIRAGNHVEADFGDLGSVEVTCR
jgi:2-keto-4-pentenoate hydratase